MECKLRNRCSAGSIHQIHNSFLVQYDEKVVLFDLESEVSGIHHAFLENHEEVQSPASIPLPDPGDQPPPVRSPFHWGQQSGTLRSGKRGGHCCRAAALRVRESRDHQPQEVPGVPEGKRNSLSPLLQGTQIGRQVASGQFDTDLRGL